MKNAMLVYEMDWLIQRVYRESDKLLTKISDTARFEERCIEALGDYLSLKKENRKHKKHLLVIISRKVGEALNSFRKEESVTFSDVSPEPDEDGDEMEFEPEDVLANVEGEVVTKEMTALLAQDDHRKKVILGNWVEGNTNYADISRSLARSFGGNRESHRKYIQRFRKECHEALAVAI